MSVLDSLKDGIGTSAGVRAYSQQVRKTLDDATQRLEEIRADKSRSPATKAVFLNLWKTELPGKIKSDMAGIEREVSASHKDRSALAPETKPISTHAALLLAESIKSADPGKRLGLVTTDPKYAELLAELPASYFGMSQQRHAALLNHARTFALTPEQRELTDSISADETQLQNLQSRLGNLMTEIEHYIEEHAGEEKKHDDSAHLYTFEQS